MHVKDSIWQAAYKSVNCGVALFDEHGEMLVYNTEYVRTCEEIKIPVVSNLFDCDKLPADVREIIEREGNFHFVDYYDTHLNHAASYAKGPVHDVTISRITSDEGDRLGYTLFVRDFSQQARQEHTLQRYVRDTDFVMKHLNGGMVYLDTKYKVIWKTVDRIYGPELGKKMYVVGSYCFHHFGSDKPCTDCPVSWAMKDKMPKERVFHDTSNDTYLYVIVTPMRDENDVLQGYLMELRDVTVREKAMRELEITRDKAKESDRMKMAFLANMSHEIRTPLNALLGFNEILNGKGSQTLTSDERERYLEAVKQSADTLGQLISDILDVSELESGNCRFRLSPVSAYELCQVARMDVHVPAHLEYCLKYPEEARDLMLNTDQRRVRQVLQNYLLNAVKYTKEGHITLAVDTFEEEGAPWIRFAVEDTGCGVPEHMWNTIFDRFVKVDSFKPGTGLGLSICKLIATQLAGRAYLDTLYTQGSRFVFEIPVDVTVEHANSYRLSDVR